MSFRAPWQKSACVEPLLRPQRATTMARVTKRPALARAMALGLELIVMRPRAKAAATSTGYVLVAHVFAMQSSVEPLVSSLAVQTIAAAMATASEERVIALAIMAVLIAPRLCMPPMLPFSGRPNLNQH